MLDGLMTLTGGNVGLAYGLLQKVIKKTELEVKTTLKEIADNIDRETRRVRRRALYALNRNMRKSPNHPKKSEKSAAHHIVAATDFRAGAALNILLKWGIDFNHEALGVYLPRYRKDLPHNSMPNAHAHSQVHTEIYHANVVTLLIRVDLIVTSKDDIVEVFSEIGTDLQAGDFPINKLFEEDLI